jgi:hypothetical protein
MTALFSRDPVKLYNATGGLYSEGLYSAKQHGSFLFPEFEVDHFSSFQKNATAKKPPNPSPYTFFTMESDDDFDFNREDDDDDDDDDDDIEKCVGRDFDDDVAALKLPLHDFDDQVSIS